MLDSISDIQRRLKKLDPSDEECQQLLHQLLSHEDLEQRIQALKEPGLGGFIELLDRALGHIPVTDDLFQKTLRRLQSACSNREVLPLSCLIPSERLSDRGEAIASGGFSSVYQAQFYGKRVCVKACGSYDQDARAVTKKALYGEVVVWKRLRHPNIVPFLGVSTKIEPTFEIVYDWMENGRIVEYVERNPKVDRINLVCDVVNGLHYLHSCNIIHGSLEDANILIDKDGRARLTDFGLTSIIREDNSTRSPQDFNPANTTMWAPKILNEGPVSKEGDVFAFAVVSTEILKEYASPDRVLLLGRHPQQPYEPLNNELWRFMRRCLKREPGERPTTDQLLEFFQNFGFPRERATPKAQPLLRQDSSDGGELESRDPFAECAVSNIQEIKEDTEKTVRSLSAVEGAPPKDPPVRASTGVHDSPGQRLVDFIDKMLEEGEISFTDQPEFLNILGKMCRRFKTIPDSMRIESCLDGPMDEEYDGGCATVFRAKYRDLPVAIKTVHLYLTSNLDECFSKFRREVVAWRHLRHPHILPLIGVNLERHRFAMVSEWMEHGNINEFVKNNKGANRVQLLIDAAHGLEYMHNIGMVHGDLKGANILINQGFRACLADFGLSTIVGVDRRAAANASLVSVASKESLVSFTAGGSIRWMSPELLDPDRFGVTDHRPTKKSDCYALGMVIYEVLCENAPFWEITNEGALINAITRGDRPQKPEGAEGLGFTKGLWEMIQRCWVVDANERPDVKDVLLQLNHAEWSWNRKRFV